jgi:hypothetical protein
VRVQELLDSELFSRSLPQLGDVLEETTRHMTPEEIGFMFASMIKEGTPPQRRQFLKQYLESLTTYHKMVGELTAGEIAAMLDDQIYAILENTFGLKRPSAAETATTAADAERH